jgi:hypothetical protein
MRAIKGAPLLIVDDDSVVSVVMDMPCVDHKHTCTWWENITAQIITTSKNVSRLTHELRDTRVLSVEDKMIV